MERQQRGYWRDVMSNNTWREIQQGKRPKTIPLTIGPDKKLIPLTVDHSRVKPLTVNDDRLIPLTFGDDRIVPLTFGEDDIIPLTVEND